MNKKKNTYYGVRLFVTAGHSNEVAMLTVQQCYKPDTNFAKFSADHGMHIWWFDTQKEAQQKYNELMDISQTNAIL